MQPDGKSAGRSSSKPSCSPPARHSLACASIEISNQFSPSLSCTGRDVRESAPRAPSQLVRPELAGTPRGERRRRRPDRLGQPGPRGGRGSPEIMGRGSHQWRTKIEHKYPAAIPGMWRVDASPKGQPSGLLGFSPRALPTPSRPSGRWSVTRHATRAVPTEELARDLEKAAEDVSPKARDMLRLLAHTARMARQHR